MASKEKEEAQEHACVVCFKGVDIFSIGQCDHPVCYECSTRMRVLCRQNECPICRQDMPEVIFTKSVQPYNTLKNLKGAIDNKYQVIFESDDERKAYEKLLAHECQKCFKMFTSFAYLRDHVRRVHQLNYCELCVENLKIYSRERRCYTRAELTNHRKDGDPDDRSHRGHPLCEFCDTRYMDNDELYRHLRRDHLYCHFCDADGLHQYYSTYDFLRDHFRSEHFLCEEGDCYSEKFTAVYRSEIDFKAHKASVHGKVLGKVGLKQARTLELEFTLAPRQRPTQSRPMRYRDESDGCGGGVVGAGAVGGGAVSAGPGAMGGTEEEWSAPQTEAQRPPQGLAMGANDFPALGSESTATSLSLRVTSGKQPSVNHPRFTTRVTSGSGSGNNYNLHFPALDNSGLGGDVSTTSVSWSTSGGGTGSRRPQNHKPLGLGHNLPPPEDFPSLAVKKKNMPSRTSTGVGTQSEPGEEEPHPHRPRPHNPPPTIQQNTYAKTSTAEPIRQPEPFLMTKTKKKKTKSKSASETKTLSPSGAQQLSEGESKLKKNKKEPKQDSKVENSLLNNIENENNNNTYHVNVENRLKTLSIVNEKPITPKHQQRRTEAPSVGQGDDFPSLNVPPGFSIIPPTPAPRWEIKKIPKPPPGLTKPPPGLPPPGFSGLNGNFPPLIGGVAAEDLNSGGGYITPNNFTKRNSSLVKLINSSLVGETLEEFKQISVAYRRGSLVAAEYYAHCREMLGPANFRELFPELLALLPDIPKQKDLWKLYKGDKYIAEITSKKKNSKLESCATCGQVLRTTDLREHLSKHSGLSSQTPSPDQNNAWSKVNY